MVNSKLFYKFMKEHWCYDCVADRESNCNYDDPKCIAFVLKYARRIDYWNSKQTGKHFKRFFSEWEQFIEVNAKK